MSDKKITERFDALTGIRILAAAAVFLSHIGKPEFLPNAVSTFMTSGYNGVTTFFILSGFVLAWNYGDRILPLNRSTLWSFSVARFARIYPLYVLVLLAVVAPKVVGGEFDPLMILHATALQAWSGNSQHAFAYNGPGWSVSVELFLYACFPIVMLILAKIRNRRRVLLVIATVIIIAAFVFAWWFVASGRADLPTTDPNSAHRWLYRMPLLRLGDFTLGVIIAMVLRISRPSVRIAVAAQVLGCVSSILLMCNQQLVLTAWTFDAAYMLPTALLIWGLASAPRTGIARPLATKPMVLFGEASYAFYLLHFPIIVKLPVDTDSALLWAVGTVAQFALILLLAIGAHFMIERPAQKWLRRALDRRKPTSRAAPRVGDVTVPPLR